MSIPRVAQVSSPRAFTPATSSATCSTSLSLGDRHAAPMQNRVAPADLRSFRLGQNHLLRHQLLRREARLEMRALRAIGAILRAAAGLDREQRRDLDRVGVEMRAVDRLGLEDQVIERQPEQGKHFVVGPVVADAGVCSSATDDSRLKTIVVPSTLPWDRSK